MKKQFVFALTAAAVSSTSFAGVLALAKSTPNSTQAPKSESLQKVAADSLHRVKTEEVCMVNNTHFGKPQLPVAVEGKTYYGCCENCKTTLNVDQSSRYSIEAWTGKKVDKATAVIAARADGSVLYFENEANLKSYQDKNSGKK